MPARIRTIPSDRRARVLAYVRTYTAEHGYPPTVREIGAALGIPSTSIVNRHLNRLHDAGALVRTSGVARGLRIVEPAAAAA